MMDKETVEMDNPAFAQQDPHLHFADEEDQAQPPQFRNKYPDRPPLFDSMLNNVRAVTKKVEHIKGFKFEISGALSNNFHLSHIWSIPHGSLATQQSRQNNPMQMAMKPPATPNYMIGAQYLGGQIRTPFDTPNFIMTGRMESSGKLEAAIIKKMNEFISFRGSAFYINSDPLNAQMHFDIDLTGDDYTHTLKLGTGLMSFNMMQTIRKRLVVGYEIMNLTERKQILMSYAGKLAWNPKKIFYAQYISAAEQLILAYNIKLLDKAFMVSELNYNSKTGDTKTVLGFRQKFQTTEVIATLTSMGKLSTSLTMNGMVHQLKLCAIVDYLKDSYKFGYGIAVGQVG